MDIQVLKEEFAAHSRQDREDFKMLHDKLDKLTDKLLNDHPTNGELGIKIDNLAKEVAEVKIQTTKTNGRVTALEKTDSENEGKGKGMRAFLGWIIAGVSLTISVIGFVIQNFKFR